MKEFLSSYHRDLWAGILFVGTVILVQIWLMGTAIMALNSGLFISYCVWAVQTRQYTPIEDITGLYFAAIAIQCIHFLE